MGRGRSKPSKSAREKHARRGFEQGYSQMARDRTNVSGSVDNFQARERSLPSDAHLIEKLRKDTIRRSAAVRIKHGELYEEKVRLAQVCLTSPTTLSVLKSDAPCAGTCCDAKGGGQPRVPHFGRCASRGERGRNAGGE